MEHHEDEQDQEHEVYGGEIPDEGEMDADVDMSRTEEDENSSKVCLSLSRFIYSSLCMRVYIYICMYVISPNFVSNRT